MSPQQVAFSPSVHQFDDPDELECARSPSTKNDGDPTRNSSATLSETMPTSPRSLLTSTGSQHDFSDYSPSPSIASVRIAHLVQGTKAGFIQARKTSNTTQHLVRTSVGTDHSAESNSLQLASVDENDMPPPTANSFPEFEPSLRERSLDPLLKELSLRHALPTSTSNDSVASWRETLEAAVPELVSPSATGRPEDDVSQRRMRSILGPKVKIFSKAPWDAEDDDDKENEAAEATAGKLETATPPAEQKLKVNGRSKSFSILTARKSPRADPDIKARDDAFRGVKLDFDILKHRPVKTSPDRSSKQSPTTTLGDSFPDLSSLASPSGPSPKRAEHSPTLLTPSDSLEHGMRLKQIRRSPQPIKVDHNSGDLLQPLRSAPPSVQSFAAVAPMYRSESGTSLMAQPPVGSSSSSSLSNSNYSGPSTPTTLSQVFPTALNVGQESYFTPHATPSPNAGAKVKLISLNEARQRESERIAAAAARRKEHMTPVEHIAPLDKSPPLPSKTKSPEQGPLEASSRFRSHSHTRTPNPLVPSPPMSVSSLPLTSAPAGLVTKTLKPKRSGFLRRMMGVDRSDGNAVPPVPVLSINPTSNSEASVPPIVSAPSSDQVTSSSPLPSPPLDQPVHVSFSPPPPVARERRGRGLTHAPSLSLRPISMAFSAAFDAELLANYARHAKVPSPIMSMASGDHFSFSERDELESVTSSSLPPTTPATPFFDQIELTSPKLSPVLELPKSPLSTFDRSAAFDPKLAYEMLEASYVHAAEEWQAQRLVLEQQVASLRRELDQLKTDPCHCRVRRRHADSIADYEWEQLRARQGGSKHLDFFDHELQGAHGAQVVLEALQKNPGATSMVLSQNRLGDNGLRALLVGLKQLRSNAVGARLREINLSSNGLTDVSLHLIALHLLQPSPHPPTITHLYLTNNAFELSDPDLARFFGSSLSSPQCSLQCLSLTTNPNIGSRGTRALLSNVKLGPGSRLSQLHLSLCNLGPSSSRALANWIEDPDGGGRLQVLGLNANRIGDIGVRRIAEGVISGRASSLIHLECLANDAVTAPSGYGEDRDSPDIPSDEEEFIFSTHDWRAELAAAQERNKIVLRETRTAALAALAAGRILFGGNARQGQCAEESAFPFTELPVELRVHVLRCLVMLKPSVHASTYPSKSSTRSKPDLSSSQSLSPRQKAYLCCPLTERQFLLLLEHCASSSSLATEIRIVNLTGKVPSLKQTLHHGYTNARQSLSSASSMVTSGGNDREGTRSRPGEWDEWTSSGAGERLEEAAAMAGSTARGVGVQDVGGWEEWFLRKVECDRFARG
ncbi:hypothetical protein OIV83_005668 [Microbotryomycetes sp. JL201]|nr:hypothetical protein OIV83_005668 [Microbotryomycetes sp. JL201]